MRCGRMILSTLTRASTHQQQLRVHKLVPCYRCNDARPCVLTFHLPTRKSIVRLPLRTLVVRTQESLAAAAADGGDGANRPPKKPVARRRRVRAGGIGGLDPVTSGEDVDQNDDGDDSRRRDRVLRPIGVRDPDRFAAAADAFLARLDVALRPMRHCNEVFDIARYERSDGSAEGWSLSVTLKPGDGVYKVEVDDDHCTILFSSPVSGGHTYVLCSKTGEWLGEDDGHSLEGLLVRDMIRQCNGYPQF